MGYVMTIGGVTLERIHCLECGIGFAVQQDVLEQRRETGNRLYCPNGCHLSYHETTANKLRKELEAKNKIIAQKNMTLDSVRGQRDSAERSAAAHKGVATRIKNRVHNGVCPCCNLSFVNLERHMKNKHPDYTKDEAAK